MTNTNRPLTYFEACDVLDRVSEIESRRARGLRAGLAPLESLVDEARSVVQAHDAALAAHGDDMRAALFGSA